MRLVALLAAIVSLMHASEGFGQDQALGKSQSNDRRIEISPHRPRKGINQGLVIAYGHLLRPPFRVELREDDKIYVNDVQVLPSMVNERAAALHPLPPSSSTDTLIIESLSKTAHEAQAQARQGVPHDQILEFARKQPYVRDAKLNPNSIKLMMVNEVPMLVELPPAGYVPLSGEEIKVRVASHLNSRMRMIENRLKQGLCVIFIDGGISEPLAMPPPSTIVGIMEDSTIPADEKIHRLEPYFVEPAARDIMANYSRTEWVEK